MSGLVWDPPAWPLVAIGSLALLAWLAIALFRQPSPGMAALQVAAGILLLIALYDVGWRPAADSRGRLVVLLDRSLSMDVPDGSSRLAAARAWLDEEAFERWTEGWTVEVDSFGGATTDPGGALESATASLPDAVLLLSDGRAAEGRAPEAIPTPLYVRSPEAVVLDDAGVLDLTMLKGPRGSTLARVEVAASGGRAIPAGREIVVELDGTEVARSAVGALAPGERRSLEIQVPARRSPTVVRARLGPAGDAVGDNDARALVWTPGRGSKARLVVGLRPGWEMGPWVRAARAGGHAVDAFVGFEPGRFRPVDAGRPRGWNDLDPERYDVALLIGDPGLLGDTGRGWIERWLGTGGRGLLWSPEGRGGVLAGAGVDVEPGSGRATPALTSAGAAWLVARGVDPATGPGTAAGWPPLEALPSGASPPVGAQVLLEAGAAEVAWVLERRTNRFVTLQGTGWYRWRLGDDPGAATGPAAFWPAWTSALFGWLEAATTPGRALVRMPVGSRVARGTLLEAVVVAGPDDPVTWRVEDESGAVAGGGRVPATAPASADSSGLAELRRIVAGPFPPGTYTLVVETPDRESRERFVVETWAPDLAWTAADTAALGRAARASGGVVVGETPDGTLPDPAASSIVRSRSPGLGATPWTVLVAAVLLLLAWAVSGGVLARRIGDS